MGSIARVPVLGYAVLEELLRDLRGSRVRKLGAVSSGGEPPDRLACGDDPVALFLGSEAFGLDEATRGAMDALVTIPMASRVDSYSVNAAAAVILYELRRGRPDGSSAATDW
jgi:23S rRNA (guanosine2251-2'-O)-methyltransferase